MRLGSIKDYPGLLKMEHEAEIDLTSRERYMHHVQGFALAEARRFSYVWEDMDSATRVHDRTEQRRIILLANAIDAMGFAWRGHRGLAQDLHTESNHFRIICAVRSVEGND